MQRSLMIKSLIDQSIKSSLIGSDGQSVIFAGEGTITPASFSVHTRGEVTITQELPPVQYGSGAATPIVGDASFADYGHNVPQMF